MPAASSAASEHTLLGAGPLPVAYLVPLAGPAIQPLRLEPKPGGLVLGRHDACDVCLPPDAEKVSRYHARFDHDGTQWRLTDLASRWGTFVNGMRLQPNAEVPLGEGDLIRITPWTFVLSATARPRALQAQDDSGHTMVRTVPQDSAAARQPLAEALLALLLESAAAIHAATDEKQLANLVIDAAIRGTGLHNAAMLRPVDATGGIDIIAARFAPAAQEQGVGFSRSLITAASQGVVAELDAAIGGDISQSMVRLRISSAICVPLMLGNTVAAFLYLDARGSLIQSLRPGSSAFCVALGRMASLALANLKRIEMEKREARMQAELKAAAVAQQWILPRRRGQYGPFVTIGESRPGAHVGGDFFDIIPLSDKRLAVAVGDVAGKGISASVLMTATQGYLHSALTYRNDPGEALSELTRFVHPRRPENRFVTMWVGIFDAERGTLSYVDAGHSYAVLHRKDGSFEQLDKGGGLPVGIDPEFRYRSELVGIGPGDKVMIVSDGIIEQLGCPEAAASATAPAGVSAEKQPFDL
ncbi:MAG TPA: SpoIIE family protein phosphatase, partial [Tepidisphaeraceae bacterium]|nr:SpoIIE family protein phosphatase [Tepidisphaeraceae bacterium]